MGNGLKFIDFAYYWFFGSVNWRFHAFCRSNYVISENSGYLVFADVCAFYFPLLYYACLGKVLETVVGFFFEMVLFRPCLCFLYLVSSKSRGGKQKSTNGGKYTKRGQSIHKYRIRSNCTHFSGRTNIDKLRVFDCHPCGRDYCCPEI